MIVGGRYRADDTSIDVEEIVARVIARIAAESK